MPSTFLGLNTGLSGINYYQAALNTTAHNAANASTKGYSRQQVLTRASMAVRVHTAYGMMGTGVSVTGIQQIRNAYYDTKYRAAMSQYSEYRALNEQLLQLQSYLNEMQSESGYTALMTRVDKALQDLHANPSDATYRMQFIRAMGNFVELINETSNNYQKTQKDINDEIAIHVDHINTISKQIFSLNKQIMTIEAKGGNANDLRDQRELLVDDLSELVNVTVIETPIVYGQGADEIKANATRYEVRIGNELLVDEIEYKQLMVVPRVEKVNQSDIDGLYDVYWKGFNESVGDPINFLGIKITGKIKGLLEARDGNNEDIFQGTIDSFNTAEPSVKITLPDGIHIDRLNIPESGVITLNCKQYYYGSWEAEYDANGVLNDFIFHDLQMLDDDRNLIPATFNTVLDTGKPATIGVAIDVKGIPYYMQELNEFVRTLSKRMNDIFTDPDGADANGDRGVDFFTTKDIYGNDLVLIDSLPGPSGSMASGDSTYYRLTGLNWSLNDAMRDINKLVVSKKDDIEQGNVEAKELLDKIMASFSDRTMFKQGSPTQFLHAITTALAVDVYKYESFAINMDEVSYIINNQRMSLSSVDQNEETTNLIMLKQGYNLSCKIISVMNEIYDKLINQTG